MTAETQEHVLNEAGEFDVHDEPVDISHYRFRSEERRVGKECRL